MDGYQRQPAYPVQLPHLDESGCYEIRMESIGGLGANLCGKLLGELGASYLGLNASAFSSYGSEKRGSPVKSYVRWSMQDQEIRHNSPVERPNLLVLFHQTLADTMAVTAGAGPECTIVVNTDDQPKDVRRHLRLHGGTLCCVDALEIALHTKSRVNMVILGAVIKAAGFIPLDPAFDLIKATLGKKYPSMLENNLNGLQSGYEKCHIQHFSPDGSYPMIPYTESRSPWGYANAPLGGANPHIGSTVSNDLSPSREGYIPLFLPEKCIHCGLCDSTCPDMVFQFLPGIYRGRPSMMNRGLDYHHCKGCLRCVDVCPTGALAAGKEREHPDKQWFVRNKDLIADHMDFEPAGADPWITGESYLDEKRVDGGLM